MLLYYTLAITNDYSFRSTSVISYIGSKMVSIKYLILGILHNFGRFLVWVTFPVFRWLYEGSHKHLPPVSDRLLMKSAVELSRMIRAREVKALVCTSRIWYRNYYTTVPYFVPCLYGILYDSNLLYTIIVLLDNGIVLRLPQIVTT